MKDESETPPSPPKRLGLAWKLVIAAWVGAAVVVGSKFGWQKLVSRAKGVKPEYGIAGNTVFYSAIGAMTAEGMLYQQQSEKERNGLAIENFQLRRKLDQMTAEKSFAQQVADEKLQKNIQPPVRS
jgi:hypothetical protein